MIRKIIVIDEEKCNGCGACAAACHEGAIGMVNGKAKLLRDDYCDGLGDCLPMPSHSPIGRPLPTTKRQCRRTSLQPSRQHIPATPADVPAHACGKCAREIAPRMHRRFSAHPSWHSGRARFGWFRSMRPTFRVHLCSSQRTALPTPTLPCIKHFCVGKLR